MDKFLSQFSRAALITFFFYVALAIGLFLAPCIAFADDLINGGNIFGTITYAGDVDEYTFDATSGDHIEIRMVDLSTEEDLKPTIELYGPSGTTSLKNDTAGVVAGVGYTIEESGTYSFKAKDYSDKYTGRYGIYFAMIPDVNECGNLENNSMTSEIIDLGDMDTFTFHASVGDHIEIRMAKVDDSTLLPRLELYGPSGGDSLKENNAGQTSILSKTIEETGVYTILAESRERYNNPGPTGTGEYNLYFTRIPGANELGTLENGSEITATIDKGDMDTFNFYATAGDNIELQISRVEESDSLIPYFEVYGPSGGDLLFKRNPYGSNLVSRTISETGVYTVLVESYWKNNNAGPTGTGEYVLTYYSDGESATPTVPAVSYLAVIFAALALSVLLEVKRKKGNC